jgi:hypothetical protein
VASRAFKGSFCPFSLACEAGQVVHPRRRTYSRMRFARLTRTDVNIEDDRKNLAGGSHRHICSATSTDARRSVASARSMPRRAHGLHCEAKTFSYRSDLRWHGHFPGSSNRIDKSLRPGVAGTEDLSSTAQICSLCGNSSWPFAYSLTHQRQQAKKRIPIYK